MGINDFEFQKQLPSGEVEEIIDAESWDAPAPFSIYPLAYLLMFFVIAILIYCAVRYGIPILFHIPPVSTPIA